MYIGGSYIWTTQQMFVDYAPRRSTNPTPAPNAPLHLKQAFMENLTRDPRLVRDLPKHENDIDQFLDWIRPLYANGEFSNWDRKNITRFLLDYIACNFGGRNEPNAQAVLKLADWLCPSGESLMICGLVNGNLTVVNAVLNAHARLDHRGFLDHYQKACVESGAPASRSFLAPFILHRAIERDDLKQVQAYAQDGVFQRGIHHLHVAVQVAAEPEIVKALIQAYLSQRRSLNTVDRFGQTALFLAVALNRYEVAELLLSNGADVNVLPCHSTKDLIAIALDGVDARLVELLLSKSGKDLGAYLSYEAGGAVRLRDALYECKVAYVETCLDKGLANIKEIGGCFAFLTSPAPHPNWLKAKLVTILMRHGASLLRGCGEHPTVVHYAMAQKDNTWLVPALIKGGMDPDRNYGGKGPLGVAISMGNDYACQLLDLAGYEK